MTKIQNTKNNEKMAEYCKTCICKSCEQIAELKAYKDVNEDFKTAWEELKALNTELGKIIECKNGTISTLANIRDRLKENIEDLTKDLKVQNEIIGKLEAENERLKALCDTYKTCYQAKHSDIRCLFIKYKQTLQEIREYAESIGNEEMINGYAIRAKSALWRIANKIAKVEEENE